ncbi:repetitive organellar protein-like isoform X2 [Leptopilina boulardi]|uniref:repetitive organellar protein-like isoform X2 n=1 Tax=Leptopilina boulardi TaxID=63433 RepID=UPI0021F6057D|nr:repetitive organellar protein-like isoform X2 [Leptopilina boulardi]
MSDLIDLNSPDTDKVLRRKLASPLIPPPARTEKDDLTSNTNGLPNLMSDEKRDSFDNNPFDKVFEETTEYVRKKEDPFELVLENVNDSKKSKCNSIEFKDDFIPKHKKHTNVLKLNKTLDDSVLDNDFNIYNSVIDNSIREKFNSSDLLKVRNNDMENVPEIFIQPTSPLNSSTLNYSAMNDSLIESSVNFKETEIRSLVAKRVSLCIQKGIMEAEGTLGNNKQLSLLKAKRCHSQGDKLSPKNFNYKQRTLSVTNGKRKPNRSERSTISSVGSMEYDDEMNKAFLQEQSNIDNSVFSDLSNISEITRLNSISSTYNSSLSFLSNGTMNQAFMKSGSISSTSQILPNIIQSPVNVSKNVYSDISDLRNKFEALKMKLSHSSSEFEDTEISKNKESNSNDQCIEKISINENKFEINQREEKLIDVEVFIPSNDSKSSKSKDSISDSSSDSVFTRSIMDKSILSEARKIAKTFEEMAEDKSNSSGFDLLSSNTEFNFDNLPDSDDEVEVNLIDLPVSPLKSADVPENSLETKNENQQINKTDNEINKIKEIEMEFTQPVDPDKKIVVTSLLLELEKLIKTEKNPDAEKLLNDLEKVLGVKWENNTDLLNVYLQNAKDNVQIDKNDNVNNEETENINLETKLEEIKDIEPEENKSIGLNVKDNLMRKSSFVIKKGKSEFIKSFSKRDSPSKVKTPIKKLDPGNFPEKQMIRKTPQSPKEQGQSQTGGVRKRFSSDNNDFNSSFGTSSNQTSSTVQSMKKISIKEVSEKIVTVTETKKSTLSNVTSAMRNKLKCKSESVVTKKGPMKATIPFGNLQRRGSFVKKSSSELETSIRTSPEKSTLHVPTSTPNSSLSSLFKKSKSKPVASSTPDSKEQKNTIIKPKSPRRSKLSCNISPVSPFVKSNLEKLASKESPQKNKLNTSSPKRASTPKVLKPPRTPSAIPKFSSLPTLQRRKSMNDLNKSAKYSDASRYSSSSNLQKNFNSANKSTSSLPKSPLRTSNKMDLKYNKITETP